MALQYRSGEPCTGRLTSSDLAREPRSLALIAYYDGWGQSQRMKPSTYARKLSAVEIEEWRLGWREGCVATAAWRERCGELGVAG